MGMKAYLTISRPLNAVISGLAALLGYLIATGTIDASSLALFPAVVLITAGGNVINDYFDLEIDRVNRPGRPIPSGGISPRHALLYSGVLFCGGIAIATRTNEFCLAIAVFNALLLVFYSARLKTSPFSGNVAVSYLSASIFLFGGALAGTGGIIQNIPLAGITFLAMVARELLKDAEDVSGDAAAGARTVPILIGVGKTVQIAFTCAIGAVVVSYLPLGRWWGPGYLAAITAVDLVIIAGAVRAVRCTDPGCVVKSGATTVVKAGMFAALAVFTVASVV